MPTSARRSPEPGVQRVDRVRRVDRRHRHSWRSMLAASRHTRCNLRARESSTPPSHHPRAERPARPPIGVQHRDRYGDRQRVATVRARPAVSQQPDRYRRPTRGERSTRHRVATTSIRSPVGLNVRPKPSIEHTDQGGSSRTGTPGQSAWMICSVRRPVRRRSRSRLASHAAAPMTPATAVVTGLRSRSRASAAKTSATDISTSGGAAASTDENANGRASSGPACVSATRPRSQPITLTARSLRLGVPDATVSPVRGREPSTVRASGAVSINAIAVPTSLLP